MNFSFEQHHKKDGWLTFKCCVSFTHPCLLYRHFKSSKHEPDGRRPNNAFQCAHFVGVNASVVLRTSVAQYVTCMYRDGALQHLSSKL